MLNVASLNNRRLSVSEYDELLVWIVAALLSVGLVMVYSSSIAIAETGRGQPAYYLIRHGLFIGVGLALGVVAFQMPVASLQKMAPTCSCSACCC